MSILLFDLDNFKVINDTFGHQAGDVVLTKFSNLIKLELRTSDYLARYGGEEFILALPETSYDNAALIAERIRKKVSEMVVQYDDKEISITTSIGIGSNDEDTTLESLIYRTDTALYAAKRKGRNLVC